TLGRTLSQAHHRLLTGYVPKAVTREIILMKYTTLTLDARLLAAMSALLVSLGCPVARGVENIAKWEPCGWGGGGFYYAAAYHPTQKGVIYMGGDVAGAYKTEDNGRTWRLINNGLVD